MRPLPPEFPAANMRWALDVLSLRKFFLTNPLDTLNQTRVFAVDNKTTFTYEELVALHHLGRLTPKGVREFAAERRALLRTIGNRHHARIVPLRPAITDGPRASAAAPARADGHAVPFAPAAVREAASGHHPRRIKGHLKRGK
jgi:hypothetical protein